MLPDDDLAALAREFRKRFESIAVDAKAAVEKFSDTTQYEMDKQFGRFVADHPELYAELRRSYRQIKKTLNKVGEDLGLK